MINKNQALITCIKNLQKHIQNQCMLYIHFNNPAKQLHKYIAKLVPQ
jgi:hypothetical protein